MTGLGLLWRIPGTGGRANSLRWRCWACNVGIGVQHNPSVGIGGQFEIEAVEGTTIVLIVKLSSGSCKARIVIGTQSRSAGVELGGGNSLRIGDAEYKCRKRVRVW